MEEIGGDRASKKAKWNVRKRLEFIEFRLFWDGAFNRKDLVDTFGISAQQASADIASYQEIGPENLSYDKAQKTYLRSDRFSPNLISGWAHRYLLQLVAIESGWMDSEDTWFEDIHPIEINVLKKQRLDIYILMSILDAIRGAKQVDMFYRSMTGSIASDRLIEPHSLSYSSGRWYVRAWSSEHNNFRDYNLNRIEAARATNDAKIDRSLDFEWHHTIDLIIVPNPELAEDRQKAVIYEYEMEDGKTEINCRLSSSFYLMSEHNLDVDPGRLDPLKQQLVLRNKEEVVQARSVARKLSKDALKRLAESK